MSLLIGASSSWLCEAVRPANEVNVPQLSTKGNGFIMTNPRKPFFTEACLRKWFKDEADRLDLPSRLYWIEAARGGTFGLQDLFLSMDGRLWPIELKAGNLQDGAVRASIRPAQRRIARRMSNQGIPNFTCVAIRKTKTVVICRSTAISSGETTRYTQVFSLNGVMRYMKGEVPSS